MFLFFTHCLCFCPVSFIVTHGNLSPKYRLQEYNVKDETNYFFLRSLCRSKRTSQKSSPVDHPSLFHWPHANANLVPGKVTGTNCLNYQDLSESHWGGLIFLEKWGFAFKEDKSNGNSVC